jgi:serine/threonine protein kinase
MPDAVTHPTPQELTAFGLGKLPERTAAAVAAHMESCTICRQAVAELPPDSFLDKVRSAAFETSNTVLPRRTEVTPVTPDEVPPELAASSKFEVLGKLGEGGMGAVWKARHTFLNELVAIKVMNATALANPDARSRFLREMSAVGQLRHRNIVRALDAEEMGSLLVLVMEYVDGVTLDRLVEKKGVLPVGYSCQCILQAAQGLQFAHEKNMVHRDIKPANLILSTREGIIKLLDFGLARGPREQTARGNQTRLGAIMGTPAYMAPEQATDASSVDIRADLYSLGCTLYFLLAGRPPFQKDSVMATMMAQVEEQVRPVTELRSEVSAELWSVMARMLAKSPKERYQTPKEVERALRPFVTPGAKASRPAAGQPAGLTDAGTLLPGDPRKLKPLSPPTAMQDESPFSLPPSTPPARNKRGAGAVGKHDAASSAPRPWLMGLLAFGIVGAVVVVIAVVGLLANRDSQGTDRATAKRTRKETVAKSTPTAQPAAETIRREEEEESKDLPRPAPPPDEKKDAPKETEKPRDKPEEKPAPAAPPPDKPLPPPAREKKPIDRAIERAIENGVAALRRMQQIDGTWKHQKIGATALAGLTILECVGDKDDRTVQAAAARVRAASPRLTDTYSLSLAVLFLDRIENDADTPLIESMAVRLIAGQTNGCWSYECPRVSEEEVRRLEVETGLRAGAPKSGRDLSKLPLRGKRQTKDLPKEIQAQLTEIARVRGKGAGTELTGDRSNTQFATMALWVGRRYGIPAQGPLLAIDRHLRASQLPSGGWSYVCSPPGQRGSGTLGSAAMPCAGLLGLAVGHGASLDIKKKKNPKLESTDVSKDAQIKLGFAALASHIGQPVGWNGEGKPAVGIPIATSREFYFLWSLGRVAVTYNVKTIRKKDWYSWGTEILLASQKLDGSWAGEFAVCGADTCFALLFLKRYNFGPDLSRSLSGGARSGG